MQRTASWHGGTGAPEIVFLDEKLFTIQKVFNSQNVRVIARDPEEADQHGRVVNRTSHPEQTMVWAAVCASGKSPLVFVGKGVKINKDNYIKDILEGALLPWTRSHFAGRPFVFQQDSAPAHKAKVTQAWCKNHLPAVITSKEWPVSSANLNPLDYSVWSVLEDKVSAHSHRNVESLKKALVKAWDELDVDYLRATTAAFPKRLRQVIRAKGGRMEK